MLKRWLVVAGVLGIVLCIPALMRNMIFLATFRAMLKDAETSQRALAALEPYAERNCRVNWQAALAAKEAGNTDKAESFLSQLIDCSPRFVQLAYAVSPENEALARQATQIYPSGAYGWYWLGDIYTKTDSNLALQAFAESARLDPFKGLAWCRIGVIYQANRVFDMAEQAFLRCCEIGNSPGYDGCYGAGRVVEQSGNIEKAIEYYRRTDWNVALQRADELEQTLKETQP